ncbi:MAG: ABC transporter permease subunit [Planctomycetota bacterium]
MSATHDRGMRGGSGAWRALRAELYRSLRSSTTFVLLLLPACISVVRVIVARLVSVAEQSRQLGRSLAAGETRLPFEASDNAYGPFVDGLRTGLALGILLLLAGTSALIAAERESGTIRVALTRSVSRTGLVIAKLAAALLLALGIALSAFLGAWLAASWLFEFGPYVEDGYQFMSVLELNAEVRRGIALAMPALLATTTFGLMVSSLTRSTGQAVAICISLYIAFDLFKGITGTVGPLAFVTYNPSIMDQSYLAEVSRLARGYSDAGYSPEAARLACIAPWPQAVLFAIMTVVAVRRRKM